MIRSVKPQGAQQTRGARAAEPQRDALAVARMVSRVLASFAVRREVQEQGDGQPRR